MLMSMMLTKHNLICLNKCLFRFGKHFELPLLAQSVIMTFTMMMLVHLCVTVKHKSEIIKARTHHFSGMV